MHDEGRRAKLGTCNEGGLVTSSIAFGRKTVSIKCRGDMENVGIKRTAI